MINEKKLVEDFRKCYAGFGEVMENSDSLMTFKSICRIINNQPKTDRWIPCSEQLPDEGQRVLATHEGAINPDRQVIQHIFWKGKFRNNWHMDNDIDSPTFGQCYMGDVIAWQPLP